MDTQYAPCACSPLGKLWRVSLPHDPNASPVWTTYTYDGSGRTITITKPDGASVTTYAYAGNTTTVTDPAGKLKKNTSDSFGNLLTVTEPDPNSSGTLVTTYSYNVLNQLTQVYMPRSNGAQTRTFQWGGTDLVSATNPENGTVTYQYDGAHHVTLRTDAKGQQTQYLYDSYGRLTGKHYVNAPSNEPNPDVSYFYDANPLDADFSQNGWGRLTAVIFNTNMVYMYSYNQAGRVIGQRMRLSADTQNPTDLNATYTWDNQGRMTSMVHPAGSTYAYQYDSMGRLSGMTENGTAMASATYLPSGQISQMTYDSFTETRTYNNLMQLTRQSVPGVMDMQYVYPATQNNGRIVQSIDGVVGETVNYTYDALNRLATAGTTSGSWSQQYTYDGFGNLTGMNGAAVWGFDPATNRPGGSYDANGLPLGPYYPGSPYVWDVENRLLLQGTYGYVTAVSWSYDPYGRRVEKVSATYGVEQSNEIYFYGITGQKLATFVLGSDGPSPSANLYFAGKLIRSNGVTVATDQLGSVRGNANGERMSYLPYGQERTSTADGREKFGTYFRDGPGQDYADQRYYNQMGAFWTPDPFGLKTARPQNPGSWNRYVYVYGDPTNQTDSHGTNVDDDPSNSCWVDDEDGLLHCTAEGTTGGGSPDPVDPGDPGDPGDPPDPVQPPTTPPPTPTPTPTPNPTPTPGVPPSQACPAGYWPITVYTPAVGGNGTYTVSRCVPAPKPDPTCAAINSNPTSLGLGLIGFAGKRFGGPAIWLIQAACWVLNGQ